MERGFLAAAALVALVVIAAVVILVAGPGALGGKPAGAPPAQDDASDSAAYDSAAPTTSVTASPLRADGSCVELSAQDQSQPVAEPADAYWRMVWEYELPFSDTAGPTSVQGDIARCYAHTPTGALLAAIQDSWRYRRSGDTADVARYLLAPGPGHDAYVQQRAARSGPNAQPLEPAGIDQVPQPVGFRMVQVTADRVQVDLLNAGLHGDRSTDTVWTVVWSGDDWRLELPSDGSAPPSTPTVPEQPYVAWDQTAMVDGAQPTDQASDQAIDQATDQASDQGSGRTGQGVPTQ